MLLASSKMPLQAIGLQLLQEAQSKWMQVWKLCNYPISTWKTGRGVYGDMITNVDIDQYADLPTPGHLLLLSIQTPTDGTRDIHRQLLLS